MLLAKLNRKNKHAVRNRIKKKNRVYFPSHQLIWLTTSIVKLRSEETYRFRTITSLQNHNVNHSITKT